MGSMPPPQPIAERVAVLLAQQPLAPRYWIAYSGGLDSTVLVHICHGLSRTGVSLNFAVVHVHHGLHPAADRWATHAQDFCRTLQFPLTVRLVDARPARGESPEAAARRARYSVLQELMCADEALLTAQHQEDQAETLLLQLLRGAGLAGLAAMPAWTAFGPGFLCRPLLDVSRSSVRDYAIRHRLQWIDDSGNFDRRFDRNYLRHEVLPQMQSRWPSLAKTVARSARHCAEASALLDELGEELLQRVRHRERNTLRVDALSCLSSARQRLVLRLWFRNSGLQAVPSRLIERILVEVIPARRDRNPAVGWCDASIRRHREELYLLPHLPPFDRQKIISWVDGDTLLLPDGNGLLTARLQAGMGIAPHLWTGGCIEIRYRQGGETLSLLPRKGTRTLKKLLQESHLPPWIRERIPLIYINGRLAAIAGRWVAGPFAGNPDVTNIRIGWQLPNLSVYV